MAENYSIFQLILPINTVQWGKQQTTMGETMSTKLIDLHVKDTVVTVTRFCWPQSEWPDRVRVHIEFTDSWRYGFVQLNRLEWVQLRDAIDAGFAEFPPGCEICGESAENYASDFMADAPRVCCDCYKNSQQKS